MKRLLLSVLVAGLVMPAPVRADDGVETNRLAIGLLSLKPKGGSVPFVGALIRERVSGGETTASFALFNGFCPEGSSDLMECMISSNGYVSGELKEREFEIDPLLRSAYLDITRRGTTHQVSWSATTPRAPQAFEAYCEEGDPVVAAVLGFDAEVSGRVLRKEGTSGIGVIEAITYAGTCESTFASTILDLLNRPRS